MILVKAKLILITILIFSILCVPCPMSLAESSDGDSNSSTPVFAESSSSFDSESSDSENEDEDSSSSDGEDSSSSEEEEESSSSNNEEDEDEESSSSEGHRFTGDPVQSKNPKFSELDLGDCDPDDGKDFELKFDETDGVASLAINNSNIKKMTGKDNFYIDFEGCRLWLPIEIPAGCVVDDNLLSNLTVSYGDVSAAVMSKVSSSVKSSQILQTFSLTLTNYDVRGQAHKMNSFEGTAKIKYAVNAACINQYNHGKQLALVFYDTDSRSLKPIEYTLDTESGEMTVYLSNSGDFFILNSAELDLTTEIKLNSNPPFLKVFLYLITFLSLGVAVGFAGFIIYKDRIAKKNNSKH